MELPVSITASATIPVVALTDSGSKFKVMAIGIGAQTTSSEIALTVTPDTKPPTISSVNGDETGTILTVGFSEAVTAPSATTAANYTLDNDGTVTTVTLADQLRSLRASKASSTAVAPNRFSNSHQPASRYRLSSS